MVDCMVQAACRQHSFLSQHVRILWTLDKLIFSSCFFMTIPRRKWLDVASNFAKARETWDRFMFWWPTICYWHAHPSSDLWPQRLRILMLMAVGICGLILYNSCIAVASLMGYSRLVQCTGRGSKEELTAALKLSYNGYFWFFPFLRGKVEAGEPVLCTIVSLHSANMIWYAWIANLKASPFFGAFS